MNNNRKSLWGEENKQAGFFVNFQTAAFSGFINDTEIRFINKTNLCELLKCVYDFGLFNH